LCPHEILAWHSSSQWNGLGWAAVAFLFVIAVFGVVVIGHILKE